MSILSAQNLTRTAGGKCLLDGVSLDINAGDSVAIIGPSGSGKTSLLRSLALLDPLERGELIYQGKPVKGDAVPAYRSTVSYLHQQPVLLGPSVVDDFERPFSLLTHAGSSLDKSLMREYLAAFHRGGSFLAQSTTELSGGEQQIVALLRALLTAPRILLLDEPTAAMDSQTADTGVRLILSWLSEPGRACIWVEHGEMRRKQVATRTLQMDQGRLT